MASTLKPVFRATWPICSEVVPITSLVPVTPQGYSLELGPESSFCLSCGQNGTNRMCDRVQRKDAVDASQANGLPGHAEYHAARFVLRDGERAGRFHFP